MSGDSFFDHYRKKGAFLSDEPTEDDGTYRAWRLTGTHGGANAQKLLLVPAGGAEQWRIPYLQTIVQRYDPQGEQLCLMFPSSDMTVFIEGRGLAELDQLIEERKVRSVHVFDEAAHQPVENDAAIVTSIKVETS